MIIENAEHSPAKKIFQYYIDCWVPQMYLVDHAFVERFGLSTSMDDSLDVGRMNAPVAARLTVAQMAEKARQGAQIALMVPEDAKQIYGWIKEHIDDWHTALSLDPNRRDAPLDDLSALEELAEQLFPMAVRFMDTQPTVSKLFNALDRLNRRVSVRRTVTNVEDLPKVKYTHNPMAHVITDMVGRRGGKDSVGE